MAISTIRAELPEIGSLNRGEVAKLVGVALINRESGSKSGKRFIGGGRGQVRRVLYMATVVAIRHNPAIKEPRDNKLPDSDTFSGVDFVVPVTMEFVSFYYAFS